MSGSLPTTKPNWWKAATCYQIWPASYKDSNADGIGDIPGIISTLPYLADLGVETIWLSPMYDSPQKDMGYDISDYEKVYPAYGTVADMDELIKQCHERGIKLILDLVINHTSDLHAWFLQSKKDKTNPKADWYIWKDPQYVNGERQPPNNWRSIFGGSAWEYVPERDQYYLHLFVPEQPDLNWELEEVRRAVYKTAITFWLDRGIDGFRVDTANLYSKDTSYPDAAVTLPGEIYQPAFDHFMNGPRMHEWVEEMRRDVLAQYGDVFMVGELPGTEAGEVLRYVSAKENKYSCVFDFDVTSVGCVRGGKKHHTYKHTLSQFKEGLAKIQHMVDGTDAWGTVFLENHDLARSVSRFATDKDEFREQAAKMLAMLLCSLTGTLFMYQGQEIGTYNHSKQWTVDDLRDVDSLNEYWDMHKRHNGDPLWMKKVMAGLQHVGRDNARLPVQWDETANAGFTTGQSWIRVHDDYKNVNVKRQQDDPDSPLNFWRRMIKIRKEHADLMIFGKEFEIWDINDKDVFTFTKKSAEGKKRLLAFLSFSDEEQPLYWPTGTQEGEKQLLACNEKDVGKYLKPWEGRLYLID